jgi:hypothetical protein
VLDASRDQWRNIVQTPIDELDQLIARARSARSFLTTALDCPASSPSREHRYPYMIEAPDRLHYARMGSWSQAPPSTNPPPNTLDEQSATQAPPPRNGVQRPADARNQLVEFTTTVSFADGQMRLS